MPRWELTPEQEAAIAAVRESSREYFVAREKRDEARGNMMAAIERAKSVQVGVGRLTGACDWTDEDPRWKFHRSRVQQLLEEAPS